MKKVRYCFLILHYKDAEMTERTVASIVSLDDLNTYMIVIVDNASPDQSGALLEKKYENSANICLIKANENEGFSKGNNLGYQFIKENFLPQFLICANNDVQFHQKDFLMKLEQLYQKQLFYVCGPDIYIPWRDFHSNPLSRGVEQYTLIKVQNEVQEINKTLVSCNKIFSFKIFKLHLAQKARKHIFMQKIYKVIRKIQNRADYRSMCENVILRGACLIFDKRFIEKNSKLFEPETFLYGEEVILGIRCKRNNWNMVYFPELGVNHLHEGNSNLGNLSYKKFCEYLAKKIEYQKEAFHILEKYIKDGK